MTFVNGVDELNGIVKYEVEVEVDIEVKGKPDSA